MKKLILVLSFFCFKFANAQNINVTINSDLSLTCKFEKVILKNPNHNFETFSNEQVNRANINKLIIESKAPDILNVKNLSKFIDKIDLEVKISNKDIVLIQAFDEPTGNLDTENSIMIANILFRYVKEEGSSLIMVTHDPKLADKAKRKIKIKDGKIK